MINILPTAPSPVSGLFSTVYREILADRASLPSMPDVALRIRAAMQQPAYSAVTVARAVAADAGTSAYLVRIANSVLYGGVTPIQDIEGAVTRLGMETTRNLVTAHALRAMFKTRSPKLHKLMQDTWRQSARIAALSSVVATRCPGFSPDRAMLAGLLQDIGVLPLLNALEGRTQSLPEPDQIRSTIDTFASKIGAVLLEHWKFDEDFVEVARSRGDWWRNPSAEPDLADLVLVARLHNCVGTDQMSHLPLINETPAFLKLPLGEMNPDTSLAFLREAESDVQEVMQMLGI
jgi:HD-like signal output (HDOD) protein